MGKEIYWMIAKTDKNDGSIWLPLVFHLLDTKYVIEHLVHHYLPKSVFMELNIEEKEFLKAAKFLALTHDIGKATPIFQRKVLVVVPELEKQICKGCAKTIPENFIDERETTHAYAGAALFMNQYDNVSIASIIDAHHGRSRIIDIYDTEDKLLRYQSHYGWNDKAWKEKQDSLFDWALAESGYQTFEELPILTDAAQMIFTGLLIMADWLSSNTYFFPLIPVQPVQEKYDKNRIKNAVKKMCLPEPYHMLDLWKDEKFFQKRFGFPSGNEIQNKIKEIAENVEEPGLMILEAPMGEGKTEAALTAAEILMNRFQLGGIAFFLPSQTTTNSMFSRITEWIQTQSENDPVSIQLVHGNAKLNPEFTQIQKGKSYTDDEDNSKMIVHSFFQGRKTNLLANVVVGTIDQLLMAGLNQKHIMLRHLGLIGKVVVIDECHAYDAYMNTYLNIVLQWLSEYHIPVILLSATLPGNRRMELVKAYSRYKKDAQKDEILLKEESYPLITWTESKQIFLQGIQKSGRKKDIQIIRKTDELAFDFIKEAINTGGCVGIILNTVKRVQEFAEKAESLFPESTILIDHSRFLLSDRFSREQKILKKIGKKSTEDDRRGVIVIGSQVLEQSLDLDFDLLITDLCPMDLLIQRIGRLHRHNRKRPESLQEARCIVLNSELDKIEKASEYIYGKYLLYRTSSLLPDHMVFPDNISPLVQVTYNKDDAVQFPKEFEEYTEKIKQSEHAAKGNRIARPLKDGCLGEVFGQYFIDNESVARVSVREGISSVEVIVIKRNAEGFAEILSGDEKGMIIPMDRGLSDEEAKVVASQRLQLPQSFSATWMIGHTIDELEKRTFSYLYEWETHPLLKGELFVILDENFKTTISGKEIQYDEKYGLLCK